METTMANLGAILNNQQNSKEKSHVKLVK